MSQTTTAGPRKEIGGTWGKTREASAIVQTVQPPWRGFNAVDHVYSPGVRFSKRKVNGAVSKILTQRTDPR